MEDTVVVIRFNDLGEARRALDELKRLDRSVTLRWGDTVDVDLASRADRQGVGGPSASTEPD